MNNYKIWQTDINTELIGLMRQVFDEKQKSSFIGFCGKGKTFRTTRMPAKGECYVCRIAEFITDTVYNQYSRYHHSGDMDLLLAVLNQRYGDGNVYSSHILSDNRLITSCSFLMCWSDFLKLCRFVFPVIKDLGELPQDTIYLLAERLISVWITSNLIPYIDGRNVAIVHYNTPELIDAAISSLNKHTPYCHIYVFDNSDKRPYKTTLPNVEVIDNTRQQLVNFDKELEKWPDKWTSDTEKSNYGSMKHTMSVDKLMELVPDGFVLMDSDVLIKEDISSFWETEMACVGSEKVKRGVPQIEPFICYLNVPKLREYGINYYNGNKMWALSNVSPNQHYETGAWLLEEVRRHNLLVRYVNIWRYILHLGHGSWRNRDSVLWLKENERLWK